MVRVQSHLRVDTCRQEESLVVVASRCGFVRTSSLNRKVNAGHARSISPRVVTGRLVRIRKVERSGPTPTQCWSLLSAGRSKLQRCWPTQQPAMGSHPLEMAVNIQKEASQLAQDGLESTSQDRFYLTRYLSLS